MPRATVALVVLLLAGVLLAGCGGGGSEEQPGERITDPARVPSSTPIDNPTLYKIQGNEVIISGGAAGQITPVAATTPVNSDYVIKSGDFCATIAADHGISLDELLKANRNIDCNNLHIGDKVKIPSAAAATPTKAPTGGSGATATSGGGSKSYTVKPGDTCGSIAASQGTTVDALRAANPSIDANCSNLRENQVLKIP